MGIAERLVMPGPSYTSTLYISRHMIVCRAAQEAGMPYHEYININRKKVNTIFTPLYLSDPLSNWN